MIIHGGWGDDGRVVLQEDDHSLFRVWRQQDTVCLAHLVYSQSAPRRHSNAVSVTCPSLAWAHGLISTAKYNYQDLPRVRGIGRDFLVHLIYLTNPSASSCDTTCPGPAQQSSQPRPRVAGGQTCLKTPHLRAPGPPCPLVSLASSHTAPEMRGGHLMCYGCASPAYTSACLWSMYV